MEEQDYWYTHSCEFCFMETKIIFEGGIPDRIYCPHCGSSEELINELDFDE